MFFFFASELLLHLMAPRHSQSPGLSLLPSVREQPPFQEPL